MGNFKVRRKVFGMSGGRFGDNDDYTDIGTTGRQTMAGTARVRKSIWLPATQWYGISPDQWANANGATEATGGSPVVVRPLAMNFGSAAGSTISMPALSASGAADVDYRAATMFFAPTDADTTGSVAVQLLYSTKVAMATAGCMQAWRVHHIYLGSGGSAQLSNSGSILYGASMSTIGNGKLELKSLGNIPSFKATASPIVALQLTLEQSSASGMAGSPEELVLGMLLTYTACALGTVSAE